MNIVVREVLYLGPVTRVLAAVDIETGASLALKLPREDDPSERRIDKIRHEHALLEELQGPGIIRLLDLVPHERSLALLMERWGLGSLDTVLHGDPLPLAKTLQLAAKIARALGRVHRKAIIHRDIKPHNILINAELVDVRLIDFGIAVRRSTYVAQDAAPDVLAGTLAYMAPEQTGRMNRSVDARADLYALGATLYQMLTFALPFEEVELAALIHAHLARIAIAPHERAPAVGIPPVVSAIVLKLMAKNPDHRYQTADGVAYDLEKAAHEWSASGNIGEFELGSHDWPSHVRKPSRLFGREKETTVLEDAYARVAGGAVEIVFLAGPSGVGKSALMQVLCERVRISQGVFASGKFDELQRGTPYFGISQALRSIIRRRLADSKEQLAQLAEVFRNAVGPNARALVDMIPELSHILGETPPLVEVGPVEAQNRFRHTLQCFLRAIATREHPLVLCVDDLQWADSGSISLLRSILADRVLRHLLLIGTYREHAAEGSGDGPNVHWLGKTLVEVGIRVQTLSLAPLGHEALSCMIADMLDRPVIEARPLAMITKAKTDGSPFFVEQFLRALNEQRLLERNVDTGAWQWESTQIERTHVTDNVASLLSEQLSHLSPNPLRIMSVAACAGSVFEVRLLCAMDGFTLEVVRGAIDELVSAGLLVISPEAANESFEFAHDRIRQATHDALEEDERVRIHYAMTVAILKIHGDDLADAELFAMLQHASSSLVMLECAEERRRFAAFFLRGGQRAKAAAAHLQAVRFLRVGLALLGETGWDDDFALNFEIVIALAEAEWIAERSAEAADLFQECMKRSRSRIERLRVGTIWVTLLTVDGRYADAIDLGFPILAEAGIRLPSEQPELEPFLLEQLQRITPTLMNATFEELAGWKRCTNPEAEAAGLLLSRISLAVVFGRHELFPNVSFAMVEHTLVDGISRITAGAAAAGAVFAIFGLQNLELASRLRYLGQCHLPSAAGSMTYAIHVLGIVGQYLVPMTQTAFDDWSRGAEIGTREGDVSFAEYCTHTPYLGRLIAGIPPLQRPPTERGTVDSNSRPARRVLTLMHQALVSGNTAGAILSAKAWASEAFESPMVHVTRHKFIACAAYVMLHLGEMKTALELALAAEPYWRATACLPDLIAMVFTLCITAERFPDIAISERIRIDAHRSRLEKWAAHTPQNFRHMLLLVNACKAWSEARHDDVEHLMNEAIVDANQNGFTNHEALGLRLLGEYYQARGKHPLARAYLREGAETYLRWGALSCANAIRERFPQYAAKLPVTDRQTSTLARPTRSISSINSTISVEPDEDDAGGSPDMNSPQHITTTTQDASDESGASQPITSARIDLQTMLRAARAISVEVVLPDLLRKLLSLALENVGAKRAILILSENGVLMIATESALGSESVQVSPNEPVDASSRLPASVVRYAAHTTVELVLDNAVEDERFSADPYIRETRPRSILCAPISHQGQLTGLLYLENNLATGVFSPQRVEMVRLMAGQAAIAIENARLYEDLENRVQLRTRELAQSNERLSATLARLQETQKQLIAQEKLASLGALTSGIAHEIKNPLNFIVNFADIAMRLVDELAGVLQQGALLDSGRGNNARDLLNDIKESCSAVHIHGNRADNIIKAMLQHARKGIDPSARRDVDINALVRETLQIASPELQDSVATLSSCFVVTYDEAMRPIAVAPHEIGRVFLNLINNALFAVNGQRRVMGVGFTPEIRVSTKDLGDHVEIRVWDNGGGIPVEIRDKIFEPFFTTKSAGDGTGLGLSLSREIVVESHGGSIDLHSIEDEFTEFVIQLPRHGG